MPKITHSPAPRARSIDQPFGSVRAHSHDPPGHLSPACCGRHCRHHSRHVLSAAREAASKALGTCNRAGWGSVRYGREIRTGAINGLSASEAGRVIQVFRFSSTWGLCRHIRSPRPASAALASRGSIKRRKTTQRHAAPTSGSLTQPYTLSERALGLALSPRCAHNDMCTELNSGAARWMNYDNERVAAPEFSSARCIFCYHNHASTKVW